MSGTNDRFPPVMFNYKVLFRDHQTGMTLWEHVPTGLRRWIENHIYAKIGVERAFGPVIQLVSDETKAAG